MRYLWLILVPGIASASPQQFLGQGNAQTTAGVARWATLWNSQGGGGGWTVAENTAAFPMPIAGTWYKTVVHGDVAAGAGQSATVILRNNLNSTSGSCSLSGATQQICTIYYSSFTNIGDTVDMQYTTTAGCAAMRLSYANYFDSRKTNEYAMFSGPGSPTTIPGYTAFGGGQSQFGVPGEIYASSVISPPGTMDQMYCSGSTFPGAGKTVTATLRRTVAGIISSTTVTATWSGGSQTTTNDVTDSTSVVAGDQVNMIYTQTGGATAINAWCGLRFRPTHYGEFPITGAGRNQTYQGTGFASLMFSNNGLNGVESQSQSIATISPTGFCMKNMYVVQPATTGVASTWVYNLRDNSADIVNGSSVSITGAGTTGNDLVHRECPAENDLLDNKITSQGTQAQPTGFSIGYTGFYAVPDLMPAME